MSTTKIREALALLSDGPDADAARAANAALREVEAVEKAAKVVDGCFAVREPYRHSEAAHAAAALMERIAKEAP